MEMRSSFVAAILVMLSAQVAWAAELIADVTYGEAGGEALLLDISTPEGEGPFPVAVLIHGGGWASGDKKGADKPDSSADITPWFQPLNDAGFVWVSINYRLVPNRWPACHEDTLTALAWVQQNIAGYRGDPDRVAVIGHSAGGQLALLTATAEQSIRPDAIVSCAGVTEFEEEIPRRGGISTSLQDLFDISQDVTPDSLTKLRSTSPINLLEPNLPPFLLIHGDADPTVYLVQSQLLKERLSVLNTRCDLLTIPNAPHRLMRWTDHDPEWQTKMTDWLTAVLYEMPPSSERFFTVTDKAIQLLPQPEQLPSNSGETETLFTKAGANLKLSWIGRSLASIEVTATNDLPLVIQYKERSTTLDGPVGSRWTLDSSLTTVSSGRAFDAYVAIGGAAQYDSVLTAIVKAPANLKQGDQWIIQVEPGNYRERVYIQREKRFVTLRGYAPSDTIISFDLHANMKGADGKALGTFKTATVELDADDFTAENITFENAAGPGAQALAIRLDGDRNIFRNCRFLGWQDTVLANRGRHYFKNCYIEGHVDYIFGGATCYFERCHLHSLASGYITAASTPETASYGYVFNRCRITAAKPDTRIYLGRPWRDHAAVTFIDTSMSENVRQEGWHNWGKPERERSSRYYEFNSYGLGASPQLRVDWANKSSALANENLTPANVLAGADGWNPVTN